MELSSIEIARRTAGLPVGRHRLVRAHLVEALGA